MFQVFGKRLATRTVFASLLCLVLAGLAPRVFAQAPVVYVATIATGAGNGTAGYTGDNSQATAAELNAPGNVAYDASGNIYIADTANNVIRKVTPGGVITTVVGTGGAAGFSGDGGPATAAQLSAPNGVAVDTAGNLYIADTGNARIREVTSGTINTIAGNGTKAVYTANGPALTSPLDGPNSIALDSAGNVYIADSVSNRCLEYVKSSQMLILFAGSSNSGGTPAGDGAAATLAKFSGPRAVASDAAGNVYLVDKAHNQIRKVNTAGIISTVAGNSTAGFTGDGAAATAAELSAPVGAAADAAGNLYIVDAGNQRIRFVSATTGFISTLAGNGTAGYTGDGGAPTSAELNNPAGIAVSSAGQTAIADTSNNVIRLISGLVGSFPATNVTATSAAQKITASVQTSTLLQSYQINPAAPKDFIMGAVTGCSLPGTQPAGTSCTVPVSFTPTAPGLRISQLIATDGSNNQYTFPLVGIGIAPAVALTPGTTSSFAGTGTAGAGGDGGAATAATLMGPLGAAFDAAGDLYIADTGNNKVRVVMTSGNIATAAGTGVAAFSGNGGQAMAAALSSPSSVALDASGNVYIADTGNQVIRKISVVNQTISTFAGTGGSGGFTGDGGAATSATLMTPKRVAVDQLGNVYIADTGNNAIREVSNGVITTIVGTGATAGTLNAPAGVAVDASGNVYIADTGNNTVRKYSNGTLTVVAGTSVAGFSGDGGAATSARLSAPTSVAVDAAGDVYIADSANNRIRVVSVQTGVISTVGGVGTAGSAGNGGGATSAQLSAPSGVTLDQVGKLYVADTANNRIQKFDSTLASLSFGSINVGSTAAAQTVTFTNFGNVVLLLSKVSVPTGFAQVASGGIDCSSSSTVQAGASCLISVVFQPTLKQTYSGSLVVTDNALNNTASTQSVALLGTGTTPSTPTAINIVAGNNQTTSPVAPFATLLKVTVTDQNGVAVANVPVLFTAPATGASGTFTNGTNVVTVTTDATGTATAPAFTANSTRGTFSVTASITALPTPATFTETIAGNPSPQLTVTLSPSTSPQVYGQPIKITVMLTPATFNGVTPGGSVTFLDGGLAIQTVTITTGSPTITITPNATTGTAHSFSATYSGDANFSSSTNSNTVNLTVTPLSITASGTSTSVVYDPLASPPGFTGVTGVLNGVLPADQANVTATFSSAALLVSNGKVIGTAPVGTYAITAKLVASATANNYTLTSTSGQITVTKAGSTVTLSASNPSPAPGVSVTLTATLTSVTTGTPTGSVSFYNGANLLGSSNAVNGVATFATTALPLGSNSITAVYGGDANFTGYTSSPITLIVSTPGFSLTSTQTSVSVAQGDTVYLPLALTAVGSYTGSITLGCSGLPANTTCVFVPAIFATSATVTKASGVVQIVTSGPGSVIGDNRGPGRPYVLATLFAIPALLLFGAWPSRRKLRLTQRLLSCLLFASALCLASGLVGCGSPANSAVSLLTPVGTSNITVTATSGAASSSLQISLTVTAAR